MSDGIDRLRAAIERRALWPAAERLVRVGALEPALPCYAAVTSRVGPGRRTDASPLVLRWIDPDGPIYDGLPEQPSLPRVGRVVGGDWDRIEDRFDDRAVPRAIDARFRDGRPWSETRLPDHVRDQVERFGDAWGHVENAVKRRCRAVESLYESMRTDGYLTQAAVAARGGASAGPPPIPALGEFTVDVGRDGRLIWRRNGQHRLAIARVLGIDRVPVLVARRHEGWQVVRDRARRNGLDAIEPSLRDHPDLREFRRVGNGNTDE